MLIELSDIDKIYNPGEPNEVHALRGISLVVQQQEMVCLRGPSGSGKTTLLSIIGCVFPPTNGLAAIGGKKVSRLPDHFLCRFRRENIGIIFQDYKLIPDLSVLENVTLPLYPAGISPQVRKRRAMVLLEQFGIVHRCKFPVSRISGGELQRVAICRALINDPSLVLADEPTAHLDSERAAHFMEAMQQVRSQGKTVVLTSHDPRVYGCESVDRVIDVDNGRLCFSPGGV